MRDGIIDPCVAFDLFDLRLTDEDLLQCQFRAVAGFQKSKVTLATEVTRVVGMSIHWKSKITEALAGYYTHVEVSNSNGELFAITSFRGGGIRFRPGDTLSVDYTICIRGGDGGYNRPRPAGGHGKIFIPEMYTVMA